MFGINSFEQVGQIVEGHWNELTNKNEDLSKKRLKICNDCPLMTMTALGPICDAKKCWDGHQVTSIPGEGKTCGCQCRLRAKSALINAKCVLGKWEKI